MGHHEVVPVEDLGLDVLAVRGQRDRRVELTPSRLRSRRGRRDLGRDCPLTRPRQQGRSREDHEDDDQPDETTGSQQLSGSPSPGRQLLDRCVRNGGGSGPGSEGCGRRSRRCGR